ncbi:MAG: acyltransferase [Tenuifilaceae bacterium]|jgi:acetyltransferase-like isoleucine patch superfamily enzyme|nr:acyltransferase [Tenuifilaceae bacterium]
MKNRIHPTSDVQTNRIGELTTIWQFCVVLKDAKIGSNCNINCNVFIENDVIIGDNVTIKPGVQIWDGLRVEDNVFIGPNVTFTNDLLPRSKNYPDKFLQTIIRKGASIGANATIIAGIEIGEYSMIGAGSVITKNVPPFTLWYGNPAKHRGYVTKSGTIISLKLTDKEGNKYLIEQNEPIKELAE